MQVYVYQAESLRPSNCTDNSGDTTTSATTDFDPTVVPAQTDHFLAWAKKVIAHAEPITLADLSREALARHFYDRGRRDAIEELAQRWALYQKELAD